MYGFFFKNLMYKSEQLGAYHELLKEDIKDNSYLICAR